MADTGDLSAIQCSSGVEVKHDRCGRLLLLADKNGRFGNGQVHSCCLHGADRLNRPCQLTLKAPLIIYLFGKLAGAEFLILHQLETDHAAPRQPLRREF